MSAVIPDPALTDWVPLGGVGGGGSMIALQEIVLGAAQATIDFTNIPQGYRDLKLVTQLRTDAAGNVVGALVRFNGDSGANYAGQYIQGSGTGVTGAEENSATSMSFIALVTGASAIANAFSASDIVIPGYASALSKEAIALVTGSSALTTAFHPMRTAHGFWNSTAAINRITLSLASGNFVAGSRATLYGLAAPITTLPLTGVRAVWGRVSGAGAILGGTGFTVTRTGTGQYTITFNTPFANPPAVIVKHNTAVVQVTVESWVANVTANGFAVQTTRNQTGSASNFTDYEWHFIAMEAA